VQAAAGATQSFTLQLTSAVPGRAIYSSIIAGSSAVPGSQVVLQQLRQALANSSTAAALPVTSSSFAGATGGQQLTAAGGFTEAALPTNCCIFYVL
jgi:hypothetical protein